MKPSVPATSHLSLLGKSLADALLPGNRLQWWLWTIACVPLLAVVGGRHYYREALFSEVTNQLRSVRDSKATAVELWINGHRDRASLLTLSSGLHDTALYYLRAARGLENDQPPPIDLDNQNPVSALTEQELIMVGEYWGWLLLDRDRRIVRGSIPAEIGSVFPLNEAIWTEFVLAKGRTRAEPMFNSAIPSPVEFVDRDFRGNTQTTIPAQTPLLSVVAPVREASGEGEDEAVRGALVLVMGLDRLEEILEPEPVGESYETYLINRAGRFSSRSRFEKQLMNNRRLQLGQSSVYNLFCVDPVAHPEYAKSAKTNPPRSALTNAARSLLESRREGEEVQSLDRDYRGLESVSAWRPLHGSDLGLITEINASEIYRPQRILQWISWGVVALSLGLSGSLYATAWAMRRWRQQLDQSLGEVRRLGHYQIDRVIGQGGMGVVYRGEHRLLKRDVAIKLLPHEKATSRRVARFEREAQITARLMHPNTVTVYDYGRTAEGELYCVMELLEGIDLAKLVQRFGPQREARVIHILRQACGSLAEAHAYGLVHRDIKPSNIMLTHRGGLFDFVKVLDFGLVKAIDDSNGEPSSLSRVTRVGELAGTPHFLAPEAVTAPQSIDARADLYGLGSVGYWLLTGHTLFSGGDPVELAMQHVNAPVPGLATRGAAGVSSDLEQVLMRCLDKNPAKRPQSAMALDQELAACHSAGQWTNQDARQWWDEYLNPADATRMEPLPANGLSTWNSKPLHEPTVSESMRHP